MGKAVATFSDALIARVPYRITLASYYLVNLKWPAIGSLDTTAFLFGLRPVHSNLMYCEGCGPVFYG